MVAYVLEYTHIITSFSNEGFSMEISGPVQSRIMVKVDIKKN